MTNEPVNPYAVSRAVAIENIRPYLAQQAITNVEATLAIYAKVEQAIVAYITDHEDEPAGRVYALLEALGRVSDLSEGARQKFPHDLDADDLDAEEFELD